MKLYEEFKLWENMWEESSNTLTEDNMLELRRGIKAEIARLKAEKAADTDPTSAYYYDEEIAAYEAELAELASKYPVTSAEKEKVLAAKRAAEMAALTDKVNYKLYWIRPFTKFGRPKYESVKGNGWFVVVRRPLNKDDVAEFEATCHNRGLPVSYNSTIETQGSKPQTLTLFDLDLDNAKLS